MGSGMVVTARQKRAMSKTGGTPPEQRHGNSHHDGLLYGMLAARDPFATRVSQISDQPERMIQLSQGAIRRMQNLKMSQAWEKWQAVAASDARLEKMIGGALNRLRNL